MKKVVYFTALTIASFALFSCDNSKSITAEDLMHHRFLLIKANEQSVDPEKQAFIEFGEHLTFNGKMCNNFSGQATLNKNVIKSDGVISTQMLCADDEQLNKLDVSIAELFKDGASVTLTKESYRTFLQLKNNDNALEFELEDLM